MNLYDEFTIAATDAQVRVVGVSPSPYLVEQLMFSDFRKLDGAYALSIQGGKSVMLPYITIINM